MAKYDAKTKDNKCIFCEIIKGNIPVASFWENKKYLAFLSIDPNTPGFSVVIPKKHFGSDVLKMPDKELKEFIIIAEKVAKILEGYYRDVGRIGLIMEGTGIDHAHIKLIPMHGTEHMKKSIWKQYIAKEEPWYPKYEGFISSAGGPKADNKKLKELAKNIKKFIK